MLYLVVSQGIVEPIFISPVVASLLSAAPSLFGVFIGFLLNFLRDLYKESRSSKREIKSIRMLIKTEINHNIDELDSFWHKSEELDEIIFDTKVRVSSQVNNLSKIPAPSWSFKAWESQISKVPIAFKHHEIDKIFDIYRKLDQISRLLDLLPSRKIDIGISVATVAFSNEIMPIDNHENELTFWDDFRKLVLEVLDKGNPIKDSQ